MMKAINTQEMADKARRELLHLLEGVRGKKNVVIERSLAGTIGLFIKFSALQQAGLDKLFFLDNHNLDASQRNVVFLVRGESASTIRTVAEQIKLVRGESKIEHAFTIICLPRRTRLANLVLEEHGVLGDATVTELPLYFVPLAQDVLSLELDSSFADLCLRNDPTCIFASAKALLLLQRHYGLFPRILAKGDYAKRLAHLLQKMRSEEDVNAASDPTQITSLTSFSLTPSSLLENLIIIDREVDFPTLLSTQLTYEGLIDELFGISNNQTEVASRKVPLDGTDKLYPTIRDANFATIAPALNRTARRLQSDQQNIHKHDQSISDLKSFVQKLPSYQAEQASLNIHTGLAEEIMKHTRSDIFRRTLDVQQSILAGSDPSSMHDTIDELIARRLSLETILRLLCLESCIANGIRQRDLEHFKRQILHAYGYQHILTLASLEKMALLVPRETHRGYLNPIAGAAGQTATDWNHARKALNLWVDDVKEEDPDDVAYVFSGYAPLSVRLVQCVLQKAYLQSLAATKVPKAAVSATGSVTTGTGWKGFEDTLSRIRGATVDVTQKGSDAEASHARKQLRGSKEGPKTSIVFFLGGVTYAEIAALRLLSQQLQQSSGRKLVIATTRVISGDRAVGAAVEGRGFGQL